MATEVLMILVGETREFSFSIRTAAFNENFRTAHYRWATHDVIGANSSLQPIGPGRDMIELTGTVYPHWKGGFYQVEALREMMRAGGYWLMVDGTGRLHGYWVIETVEETADHLMANGAPLKQMFRLALAYAGEQNPLGQVA